MQRTPNQAITLLKQPIKLLFEDTDQCVKCGLCLPHCPTYTLTQDENESPRGRLSLIDGWANGLISPTNAFHEHLDHCLLCRACESVCPAKVPYGRLIDDFRAADPANSPQQSSSSTAIKLLLYKRPRLINGLLRIYQKTGIRWLLRSLGLLKLFGVQELDDLLPKQIERNHYRQPAAKTSGTEKIAIFTGCASNLLDARTIHDAIRLLSHCGFDMTIPEQQTCCGAIDWHAGRRESATQRANKNTSVFKNEFQHIVSLASGCGATLQEYPNLNNSSETHQLAERVIDISELLLKYEDRLEFTALAGKVWLHTPCTLKNVMNQADAPFELLQKIPDIQLTQFTEPNHCCGAAGTHMMDYPERARALREPLIEQIKNNPPDILLTSNIGCAMHLRAGIRQAGLHTDVLHPVSLLAQQLLD